MNEQRTPDELTSENALICEKLLGWIVDGTGQTGDGHEFIYWTKPDSGFLRRGTPAFTNWADAGLVLEALSSTSPTLEYTEGRWDCYGGDPYESFFHAHADTGPLAVRAAALEYIRRLP